MFSSRNDADRGGHNVHKRHHIDDRGEDEPPGTFIPLHTFEVQTDSSMGGRPTVVVGLCTLVSIVCSIERWALAGLCVV